MARATEEQLTVIGSRPRSDAMPEGLDYRDEGCEESPSCLRCPLARCRYDVVGGARIEKNRHRDAAIRRAWREEGLTPDELAARFGLARRSIYRVLEGYPRPSVSRRDGAA